MWKIAYFAGVALAPISILRQRELYAELRWRSGADNPLAACRSDSRTPFGAEIPG
jgi:hypothetical protein